MKVRGSSQKRKEPSPISKMELFAKIVDWVLNTLLQPAGEYLVTSQTVTPSTAVFFIFTYNC